MHKLTKLTESQIHTAIVFLRGKRTIIDTELMSLYDNSTMQLSEQVGRNTTRIPEDFFRLTREEFEILMT